MTTKLNNAIREEIIANVIKATDLPAQEQAIRDRIKSTVRLTIIDAQPAGFCELVKHAPKEWFQLTGSVYIYCNGESPRQILAGRIGGTNYNTNHVQLDDPVVTACSWGLSSDQWTAVMNPLIAEAKEFVERYNATYREISAFLKSCTTVEKVLERMPELERHIPKISKPLPLVAPSNLLSTLAHLGFDRTAVTS